MVVTNGLVDLLMEVVHEAQGEVSLRIGRIETYALLKFLDGALVVLKFAISVGQVG